MGLAFLGALSVVSCDGQPASTLTFRAGSIVTSSAELHGLLLVVGGARYGLADFRTDRTGSLTLTTRAPDHGTLGIDVALEREGVVVASGTFELEMQPAFEWNVLLSRGVTDPATTCFGCAGSAGFAIADDSGASLWVVWSGQRYDSDVVY